MGITSQEGRSTKKKFLIQSEILAAIPGIGAGIFSLTKEQLLLLWISKEKILAETELYHRQRNSTPKPDRIKQIVQAATGDEQQATTVSLKNYHETFTPSY